MISDYEYKFLVAYRSSWKRMLLLSILLSQLSGKKVFALL